MWFFRLSVKSLISSFPICWDQRIISKVVLLSICSQVGHRQIGLRIFQRDLQVAWGQNSGSYVILKCNTSGVCSLNPTTLKSYAATWQKSPNLLKRLAAWSVLWSVQSFYRLFSHVYSCVLTPTYCIQKDHSCPSTLTHWTLCFTPHQALARLYSIEEITARKPLESVHLVLGLP